MENAEALKVTVREGLGKGFARRLRQSGQIPGVCYGANQEPVHVAVDPKELRERLTGKFGVNAIFKLEIEGQGITPTVRVSQYQKDPVERTLLHADFTIVDPEKPLKVKVPLKLVGRAKGVGEGGRLRQVRRVLNVVAMPSALPAQMTADVTELKIGDILRVEQVEAIDGVEIIYDHNFAVATVFQPRAGKGKAATATEADAEAAAG